MAELTSEQLDALGYVVEEIEAEEWTGRFETVLEVRTTYAVTAPDGQLIAEGLDSVDSAYRWARWHASKQP